MPTIIPNKDLLEKKKQQFSKDNFHIIADFDKTLTKAFFKGKKVFSSWALIRDHNYLGEEYIKKAEALFEKYYPIEMSKDIEPEERKEKMKEWWIGHRNLLIESGITKEIVLKIIKEGRMELREGGETFFNKLKDNKIPLLIFSAGMGNVIEEFLKMKTLLTENVHIISNFFKFENNKAAPCESRVVHTYNKNETQIANHPYSKEIKEKKNVLLLGDSLGDLGMSEGIEHNEIIRIGFLNDEKHKEEFLEEFDIIITEDGPMEEVNKLIREIIK